MPSSITSRLLPQCLTTARNTLLLLRSNTTIARNAAVVLAAPGSSITSIPFTTSSTSTTHYSRNALSSSSLASSSLASSSTPSSVAVRPFSTEITPGVGLGKTSTGLVGIAVDPDAIPKLIHKNQALLSKMAASDMPPTAQYYINVAQISNYRIQACHDHPNDPEAIEELCQCGQIEELVIQADNEMIVLDMYLRNKWWLEVKDTEIEYGDPEDDGGSDEEGVDWDEGQDRKDGGEKK